MADRELVVRIIGDDKSLQQAFARSGKSAQTFQGQITGAALGVGRLFAAAGITVGTAAAVRGINAAVDAASDLNEQISKSRQVFRDASAEVERWSETTASGLGIAQREALAATGTFGNLFRVIDIAPDQASEMSRALVQLAADLASFNNANPDEVLNALRSGLIGEAEPLRRFGVLLSEARVQQEAMAETGKTNVKALTDQEKALARFRIIMQDTASAQGDFARTSEGLANQSRILHAQLDDLSASLGTALLPAITTVVEGLNFAVGGIEALGGALDALGDDFDAAEANLSQLTDRLAELDQVLAGPSGADFAPLAEPVEESIVAVSKLLALTESGRETIIRAFRQASAEVDAALRDGVITPLEQAQLETTLLGQLFLQVAPENVLSGLGASVRSGIEDATAIARVGVEDLGAEIRSGIEDASRGAALVAREGGEQVGVSFVEGLKAASARIEGQVAGLGEQVIRAQIEGNEQAELDALRQQQERLQRQLEIQEEIVAGGGRGAATARRKIREEILPQLLAVSNAIDSILEERDRRLEETRRNAEEKNRKAREKQREILDNRQEQAELLRQVRQERQFEQLGLTAEGDERVPGVGALRRRLRSIQEQLKGTSLDTEQTRTQLDRIRRVLSGKFGEVGREVRQSILEMFRDINEALEGEGGGGQDVRTKFQKRGIGFLLEGLGLSPQEERDLRARFAQVGPGGVTPGAGVGAFGFALQPGTRSTATEEFHIYIDGEEVESRVTRRQQRKDGRTAKQRRGVRAGR